MPDKGDYDAVAKPRHYVRNGHECKADASAMMEGEPVTPTEAAHWFCAFKYLWRWPEKGSALQDLRKCRESIDNLIKEVERDERFNDSDV